MKFGKTAEIGNMNWTQLNNEDGLGEVKERSTSQPVIIFKHSTRCPVSHMALSWFERSWKDEEMQGITPYYLDLVSFRNISNQIAQEFEVQHESPQLLLIKDGKCTYHRSHSSISYKELKEKIG